MESLKPSQNADLSSPSRSHPCSDADFALHHKIPLRILHSKFDTVEKCTEQVYAASP